MVKQHLMRHHQSGAELLGISYNIYNTPKQRILDVLAQELAAGAGDTAVYAQWAVDGGAMVRGCVRKTNDGTITHLLLWDEPEDIKALMLSWPLGAAAYRMNVPAGATPCKLPEISADSLRGDASKDLRASCEALQTCFWREDGLLAKLLTAIAESQKPDGARVMVIMDAPADEVSERARALMEILMRSLPFDVAHKLAYRTLCDSKRGTQRGVGFYSAVAAANTTGAVVLRFPEKVLAWPGEALSSDADTQSLARALGELDFDAVDQFRSANGPLDIRISAPTDDSIPADYAIEADETGSSGAPVPAVFETDGASFDGYAAAPAETAAMAAGSTIQLDTEPVRTADTAQSESAISGMIDDAIPYEPEATPAPAAEDSTSDVAKAASELAAAMETATSGTASSAAAESVPFKPSADLPDAPGMDKPGSVWSAMNKSRAESSPSPAQSAPIMADTKLGEECIDLPKLEQVQSALKSSLTYANSDEFRRFTAEFLKERTSLGEDVFTDYCARYSDCLHRFNHPMSSVYDSALADMIEEADMPHTRVIALHNTIAGYPGAKSGVRVELKKRGLPEFIAALDMPSLSGQETPLEFARLWAPAVKQICGEYPQAQQQECLNLCTQCLCKTLANIPQGISATSYLLQAREAIEYLEHKSGLLLSDADFDSLVGRIIERFDFNAMEVYDAEVYDALQYAYLFVKEWEMQRTDMQRAVCVWGRLINGAGNWGECVMDGVAHMLAPMSPDNRAAFITWVKSYFEGLCSAGLTESSMSDSFTCFAVLSCMEFDKSGNCRISGWSRRCARMQLAGSPGVLDVLNELVDTHKYIMGDAFYKQVSEQSDPRAINDPEMVAELESMYAASRPTDFRSVENTLVERSGNSLSGSDADASGKSGSLTDPASAPYDTNEPLSDSHRYPIVDEVRHAINVKPLAEPNGDQYDDGSEYDEYTRDSSAAGSHISPFAALSAKLGFNRKKSAAKPAPQYDFSDDPAPEDESLPPAEQYDREGPYADDEEYDDSPAVPVQNAQEPDAFSKVGALFSGMGNAGKSKSRTEKAKPKSDGKASSVAKSLAKSAATYAEHSEYSALQPDEYQPEVGASDYNDDADYDDEQLQTRRSRLNTHSAHAQSADMEGTLNAAAVSSPQYDDDADNEVDYTPKSRSSARSAKTRLEADKSRTDNRVSQAAAADDDHADDELISERMGNWRKLANKSAKRTERDANDYAADAEDERNTGAKSTRRQRSTASTGAARQTTRSTASASIATGSAVDDFSSQAGSQQQYSTRHSHQSEQARTLNVSAEYDEFENDVPDMPPISEAEARDYERVYGDEYDEEINDDSPAVKLRSANADALMDDSYADDIDIDELTGAKRPRKSNGISNRMLMTAGLSCGLLAALGALIYIIVTHIL